MTRPIYHIPFTSSRPKQIDAWDTGRRQSQNHIEINHFRVESSSHHPLTRVKLCYDELGIYGIFEVIDCYIICRHKQFQDPVYKDSCVEFFLQPKPNKGYFNFEFNCCGTLLASYITDPTRIPGGLKGVEYLRAEEGKNVQIRTSLSSLIDVEITDPIDWKLTFFIPFKLLMTYVGKFKAGPGTDFRANFFKCADDSSHPHWAAWSPVEQLNFHMPRCFGMLKLT